MTIGDILAVIAAVLLLGASWAATLIMTALVFPSVVSRAETKILVSPASCIWRGIGAVVGVLFIATVLHGAGPLRLISAALWCGLLLASAIGGASIVRLMGERIGALGSEMTPFARLTRSSALYVGAGFVPIVGWFVIAPIAALMTVGAGLAALRADRKVKVEPILPPVSHDGGQGIYPGAAA
jgi:hypothetical protein